MINSKEYWDNRFATGDWESYGGQEQTRFFYELAINHLPSWLVEDIRENDLSIVDMGCAEGDGTSLFKKIFSRSEVVGIDFSEAAVQKAQERYPQCHFRCEDIADSEEKYDVIFSSNVLEHLRDPFEQLEKWAQSAEKYCIVILPFEEDPLHEEHLTRFDYSSFMLALGDSYLVYHKEIDTSKLEGTMWQGRQIILVYVKETYLCQKKAKLSRMDNGDFASLCGLDDEIEKVKKQLQEKEKENLQKQEQLQQYEESLRLREREVEELKEQLLKNEEVQRLSSRELEEAKSLIKSKENELQQAVDKIKQDLDRVNHEKENLVSRYNQLEQDSQYKQHELAAKLANDENGLLEIKHIGIELAQTKLFKWVHLMYRIKQQFLKGNMKEKKLFFEWMHKRKNQAITDHSLNPIFQMIDKVDAVVNQSAEISNVFSKRNKDGIQWHAAEDSVNENLHKTEVASGISEAACTVVKQPEKGLNSSLKRMLDEKYEKFDILFLSVIDYNFRYQRPQHLAQAFSKQGHRVFYINANFNSDQTKQVECIDEIRTISMKSSRYTAIYGADYTQDSKEVTKELEDIVVSNGIRDCLIVVEYPTWVQGAVYLKEKYGFKMITDYLDDYTGFEDTNVPHLAPCCYELLQKSDRIIASSNYLAERAEEYNQDVKIVRNGTEYKRFHQAYEPEGHFAGGRKVIGYYGAIAHWFDFEKVIYLAERLPEVDIVLIGEVSENKQLLSKYSNIKLLGEKPYKLLPDYLKTFDVCLIPFDTSTDLIKATNPVKFYEYLSAAKKVVATEIPELMPFKDKYVYLANDNEVFLQYVKDCLEGKDTLASAEECLKFAQENDWEVRGKDFIQYAKEVFPKVSIIVLTYNQLAYTKECISSIITKTAYPNYEVIIVDNKSSDETPQYLLEIEKQYSQVKVILNEENTGFAAGNNIGIKQSSGDYIVLLNNDTVVTRGWLTGMIKHLEKDKKLGIIGPVTNSIGNEAKINAAYTDISEMEAFAYEYTADHMNTTYDGIKVLAMFCIMISRETFNKVGYLEQIYGIGMFEDDDYSYKAQALGYEVKCAEDVFIHHYGNVSFKKLQDKEYAGLFNRNKKIFEDRWHVKWEPHQYRGGVN